MNTPFFDIDFDPNDPGEAPYLPPEPQIDLSSYIQDPVGFRLGSSPITSPARSQYDENITLQAYSPYSPQEAGELGREMSDRGINPTFTNMPTNPQYADSGQIAVDMRPPTSYEPTQSQINKAQEMIRFIDFVKNYVDSKYPANYSTPQIEAEKQSLMKFMMEQYSKDLDKKEKQQEKLELKEVDLENKKIIAEQKAQDALEKEKFKTDVKRQNMFNIERKVYLYNVAKLQDIADAAKELLKAKGLSKIAGLSGYAPNFLIGDEGRDADAKLQTLQAKISFDTLRDMRDNSKTGGALGQVSDVEIKLLMNSLVPLTRTMSEGQFKESLEKIIKVTDRALNRIDSAYREIYGDLLEEKSSTSSSAATDKKTTDYRTKYNY